MSSPVELAADLLRYVGLCGVSVAIGLSILRLLQISLRFSWALMLAPALTLCWWAVWLGFGSSMGIPLRTLAMPVWVVSAALALHALVTYAPRLTPRRGLRLALATALPLFVMSPYFLFGLARFPGSLMLDGWSYAAQGQYLWTYPNGTEGGLAPLHQYAVHLTHVRHVAGAMLGFFSPLFAAGDTQTPSALLPAWALFVFATSCAFYALVVGLRSLQLVAYLVFVTASGWIANVVWANNFDNAFALGFAPVLAGLLTCLKLDSWASRVLLGFVTGALLHVYPELAAFPLLLGGLIVVYRWRRDALSLGLLVKTALTSCAVALALTLPFLPSMMYFVSVQAAAGFQSPPRPGEHLFLGLVSLKFQPSAFWGLGGEFLEASFIVPVNVGALLLTILASIGTLRILRSRHAATGVWLLLMVAASLLMIFRAHYTYGAYKLIILSWWALGLAVVLGIESLAAGWSRRVSAVAIRAALHVALIVGAIVNTGARQIPTIVKREGWDMDDYRRVRTIEWLTGSKPVMVAVDEMIANQWAVYYLRDLPIALVQYRALMAGAHIVPFLERARAVPWSDVEYVLTDARADRVRDAVTQWAMVWSSGPYRLWQAKRQPWNFVGDVTTLYGLDKLGGKPFFWMGTDRTVLDVVNSADGVLEIRANFILGPAVPSPQRRLRVAVGGDERELIVASGVTAIRLPVKAGMNHVTMAVLDPPTVPPAGEDPRTLVLGVQILETSLSPE